MKQCPRCGGTPAEHAKRGSLCEACQHTSGNGSYVWDQARREVSRLTRSPEAPTHRVYAYRGEWTVRGGIRRPA